MYQRYFLVGLLIASQLSVLGCGVMGFGGSRVVKGNGHVADTTVDVSGFSGLALSGMGEVLIERGEKESVRIEAEDNILPYLTAKVEGGRLVLGQQPMVALMPTLPMRFYVTVKDLDSIDVSGAGSVRGPSFEATRFAISISGTGKLDLEDIQADVVDVDMSGNGSVEVDSVTADSLTVDISGTGRVEIIGGEVDSQQVKVSGAGSYSGRGVHSRAAIVDISGAGSASITAGESLDIDISGVGSLEYAGNPSVKESITGAGRVKHLGE